GYKGLTTCVERITHWVIRPTRRLFANALSALTKSEYCAIFAQYSGNKQERDNLSFIKNGGDGSSSFSGTQSVYSRLYACYFQDRIL
ncbi:MAG: hypothetical protein L6455_10170, partial [Kiritimatiellae bacterium]|nr:hypothetical protein [Kiritimatiellia bacterium]